MAVDVVESKPQQQSTAQCVKVSTADGALFELPMSTVPELKTIAHMIADMGDDFDAQTPIPVAISAENLKAVLAFHAAHKQLLEEINLPIITTPRYPSESEAAAAIGAQYDISKELEKRNIAEAGKEKAYCVHIGTNNIDTMLNLIKSANYLNYKQLLCTASMAMTDMLSGKTPDEIRQMFGITYNFTPEEEEQIIKENPWCTDTANDPFLKQMKAGIASSSSVSGPTGDNEDVS